MGELGMLFFVSKKILMMPKILCMIYKNGSLERIRQVWDWQLTWSIIKYKLALKDTKKNYASFL